MEKKQESLVGDGDAGPNAVPISGDVPTFDNLLEGIPLKLANLPQEDDKYEADDDDDSAVDADTESDEEQQTDNNPGILVDDFVKYINGYTSIGGDEDNFHKQFRDIDLEEKTSTISLEEWPAKQESSKPVTGRKKWSFATLHKALTPKIARTKPNENKVKSQETLKTCCTKK